MDRSAKIESYGNAHDYLLTAIEKFPREMWQYRPAADEWTIHEIIVHITDSEVNSYVRCRRFLAEPGQPLMVYDEMGWARALDYHSQSTDDALALFKWLRKMSYDLIKGIEDESVWSKECFHPESGLMTMDAWLDTYERHVREHVAQMEGVYVRWRWLRH
jgi:hypothetical protein